MWEIFYMIIYFQSWLSQFILMLTFVYLIQILHAELQQQQSTVFLHFDIATSVTFHSITDACTFTCAKIKIPHNKSTPSQSQSKRKIFVQKKKGEVKVKVKVNKCHKQLRILFTFFAFQSTEIDHILLTGNILFM